MRKATWFDFIDVTLYEETKYRLRDMDYYILNSKGEYEKYHTSEAVTWDYLKQYDLYVEK